MLRQLSTQVYRERRYKDLRLDDAKGSAEVQDLVTGTGAWVTQMPIPATTL